jgi:hypothetical protein
MQTLTQEIRKAFGEVQLILGILSDCHSGQSGFKRTVKFVSISHSIK